VSNHDDNTVTFDRYAANYDFALNNGLRFTGESAEYYLQQRIEWVRRRLADRPTLRVRRVLDFGCGLGRSAPVLRDAFGVQEVVGLDESPNMVSQAHRDHPWATFAQTKELKNLGVFDLVYCNGVFHHIAPKKRLATLTAIRSCLSPHGTFALWENNPYNPGTRFVMSRVSFDRDANLLSAAASRKLLRKADFAIRQTDFLFLFPALLKHLRPIERYLVSWPLGGQYMILAHRS
jgi:trans-aconitate methyltransferase